MTNAEVNWRKKWSPFLLKICRSRGQARPWCRGHRAPSMEPAPSLLHIPRLRQRQRWMGTPRSRNAGAGRTSRAALRTGLTGSGRGTGGLKGDARATSLTVKHGRANVRVHTQSYTCGYTHGHMHACTRMCPCVNTGSRPRGQLVSPAFCNDNHQRRK